MPDSEKEITLHSSLMDQLRVFAGSTTAHSVSRMFAAEHKRIRMMWVVVFFIFCGIFSFHLSRLVVFFISVPIDTSTSFNSISFVFPDVTICNLLPFSLRKLERKDPGLERFTSLGNSAPEHREEALEDLMKGTENDKFNTILSCSYNNEPCSANNFTVISDPVFRSCFTFSPEKSVMANTPEYGLNLLVYAENSHAHPMVDFSFATRDNWESSGVRLIIHDKNTRPYPDLRGVNVQPGVNARFGVSMNLFNMYNVYRDGKGRCDDDAKEVSHCVIDSSEKGKTFKEIPEDCYIDVIQGLSMSRCKCLSHDYAVPSVYCQDKPINSTNKDFCDADTNECYRDLMHELRMKFQSMVVSKCVETCVHREYSKELSTSAWPSHVAELQVNNIVRQIINNQLNEGIDTTLDEFLNLTDEEIETSGILSTSFLKLCIYAESLTANEITEEPAYPLANFVSEIGGILGLWLGGSMLTFAEPLELFVNMCCVSASVRKQRRRQAAARNGIDVEANLPLNEDGNGFDAYGDSKADNALYSQNNQRT